MASQLASGDLVSDRYASALYELAAEKKLVDSVLNDLSNLKNILQDNKEHSDKCNASPTKLSMSPPTAPPTCLQC